MNYKMHRVLTTNGSDAVSQPSERAHASSVRGVEHIRPGNGQPMYQQVCDRMRRYIEDGVWKPGDLVPTELELSKKFGISPGTVKQAVLALVREHLLTRRSGKGTYVTRLDLSRSFARFFRFRERSTGQDLSPVIRVIDARIIRKADAALASRLGISRQQSILVIRRLMLHNNVPVCLHISYLPYRLVRGLEDEDLNDTTLYDILDEKFGIVIVHAEELLSAIAASKVHARLLKIPVRHPVIMIERTAMTYRGVTVEWRQTVGRSDEFRYRTELR
jgi:GntR family transcriptional regulator